MREAVGCKLSNGFRLDRAAVTDIQPARRDHRGTGLQAPQHRVAVVLEGAELHRGLDGETGAGGQPPQWPQSHLPGRALQLRQGADNAHEGLARQAAHRREGHHQGLPAIEGNAGAAALTAAQRRHASGLHPGAHRNHLTGTAHGRIDRAHLACGQRPIAETRQQEHALARPHPRRCHRRHIDAGLKSLIAQQAGEHLSGLDHIAGLHGQVTHHAIDRGTQVFEGEIGLTRHQGFTGSDVGLPEFIALQGTGRPLAHQLLEALKVELAGFHLGPQAGHLGAQLGLIQHQEQLTASHPIALSHQELLDPSTGLGRELHLLIRLQAGHGTEAFAPLLLAHDLGLHRCDPHLLRLLAAPHKSQHSCRSQGYGRRHRATWSGWTAFHRRSVSPLPIESPACRATAR